MMDSRERFKVVWGTKYERISIVLALSNSSVPFAPVAYLKTPHSRREPLGGPNSPSLTIRRYCLNNNCLNMKLYSLEDPYGRFWVVLFRQILNFYQSSVSLSEEVYLPLVAKRAIGTYFGGISLFLFIFRVVYPLLPITRACWGARFRPGFYSMFTVMSIALHGSNQVRLFNHLFSTPLLPPTVAENARLWAPTCGPFSWVISCLGVCLRSPI